MAHHYGAGWRLHTAAGPGGRRAGGVRAVPRLGAGRDHAERAAAGRRGPRHPGPLGDRHPPGLEPAVRLAQVRHRRAPRVLRAVRAEASSGGHAGAWITPQTRDMNPVYTGKDVSYIDTKQAQRAIETAVAEAERLGHPGLAGRRAVPGTRRWTRPGGCWPSARTTTAITGVESDQVYLDLLGGWREAWELGVGRPRATPSPTWPRVVRPRTVSVASTGWPGRGTGWRGSPCRCPRMAPAGWRCGTIPGRRCRRVTEGVRRRPDGSLAEVTLTFLALAVPALGLPHLPAAGRRRPRPRSGGKPPGRRSRTPCTWSRRTRRGAGRSASPTSGTGASVLAGPGNELVIQDEYAQHPRMARARGTCAQGAGHGIARRWRPRVRAERCAVGSRLLRHASASTGSRSPRRRCCGTAPTGRVPHPRGRLPSVRTGCSGCVSRRECRAGCRCTRRRRR